jgi:hypothetical protein
MTQEQRRQALLELQAADLRLATIAFRLAVAGNEICPRKSPLLGVILHDQGQYAAELRSALGAGNGVSVLAVVPGSPADRAGLHAGDILRGVNGAVLTWTPPVAKPTYTNVGAAYHALEAAAADGTVSLRMERDGLVRLSAVNPVSGCASRVQLLPSLQIAARADGSNLSITTAMLDYVRNDDELALTLAHEMAHNALGHRALLRSQQVKRNLFGSYGADAAKVRETEQAADRLGYYLMARSGYDLGVAPRFWDRLYNGPASRRSPPRTHPGSAERITEATLIGEEIAAKRRRGKPVIP